ncbi:MAG: TGS domain-containing protein [Chloroflexi bacterium]|nr:TGS domain-containing protein [Chloroflexota bacterium]
MPTNLPPQYFEAEKRYRQAHTPAEKLEALETMLAIMPKHKGTDHLKAHLRARMAAVTQEAQRQAHGGGRAGVYDVPREGAGQVTLVGLPNAGKSQLLAALTDAAPKVADYPFTTQAPQPAMMPVDNAQVQLVDLPALAGAATTPWLRAIIRQADLALLVIALAPDPLADWALLQTELAALHLRLVPPGATTDDEPDAVGTRAKRALIVATHADAPAVAEAHELLALVVGDALPLLAVSGVTGAGLDDLRHRVFAALDVIRVYPKPPGKPVDRERPFVLPRGSTIEDLAGAVHRDIQRTLRYAILWGVSGKFSGQRVGRQHVLEDEDIVALEAG